jgi:outer membrane protein TolC
VAEPPDYPTAVEPLEKLEQLARDQREDLRVAQLQIDQDVQRRRVVLGQYGPKVYAQWSNQWIEPETFATKNNFWDFSLNVTVPFFEGGQRDVDRKRIDHEIIQSRLNEENVAKSIEVEVKQAWLNVRSLEKTLASVQAEVEAAEENYKSLENQYRAGTATSLDVLDALRDLTTARTEQAIQTYDYQVALRNVERAAGVFQEERVQKVKKQ